MGERTRKGKGAQEVRNDLTSSVTAFIGNVHLETDFVILCVCVSVSGRDLEVETDIQGTSA